MHVFHLNLLKSQGNIKVKVKGTECQCQMKENQFSVYCKCSCDLCVMRMVCLWLKGILVADICGHFTENEAGKQPSHWLTLRQNLLILSKNAEFIELPAGWSGAFKDQAITWKWYGLAGGLIGRRVAVKCGRCTGKSGSEIL